MCMLPKFKKSNTSDTMSHQQAECAKGPVQSFVSGHPAIWDEHSLKSIKQEYLRIRGKRFILLMKLQQLNKLCRFLCFFSNHLDKPLWILGKSICSFLGTKSIHFLLVFQNSNRRISYQTENISLYTCDLLMPFLSLMILFCF